MFWAQWTILASSYVDDIVLMVTGKFCFVSGIMIDSAKQLSRWYTRKGLSVNPDKIITLPFTSRRDLGVLRCPELNRVPLELSEKKAQNWNYHLSAFNRTKWSLLASRRIVASTWWDYWFYEVDVHPRISYVAWRSTANNNLASFNYNWQFLSPLTAALKVQLNLCLKLTSNLQQGILQSEQFSLVSFRNFLLWLKFSTFFPIIEFFRHFLSFLTLVEIFDFCGNFQLFFAFIDFFRIFDIFW